MGKTKTDYFIIKNMFDRKYKKTDYKISQTSEQKHKQNQECFNVYYNRA